MDIAKQEPKGGMPSIMWKIIIPVVSGGVVYLASNLGHEPQEWSLLLSAFLGGVVLVVQFLIDFEQDLRKTRESVDQRISTLDDTVRRGLTDIDSATRTYSAIEASPVAPHLEQLIVNAVGLIDALPSVALRLARAEIDRVADTLQGLSVGRAQYEGEDQDWLLGLVRAAKETIDATSTPNVDGDGKNFNNGLWASSLGQRYLRVQRDATTRRVAIRRLFIISHQQTNDPDFKKICQAQTKAGIDVRVLDPARIPSTHGVSFDDFIIFDRTLSYIANLATRYEHPEPYQISTTEISIRENGVKELRKRFEELWEIGCRPDE